jgi:hypothetical protein
MVMPRALFILCLLVLAGARPAPLAAQFIDDKPAAVPVGEESYLRNPRTIRMEVGMTVRSGGGTLRGVYATTPVPTEWEDQKVKIVKEDRSPEVRGLTYRPVGANNKQMVVTIPTVPPNGSARVIVTYELTRYEVVPPKDTTQLRIPEKVDSSVRPYLGASPYIEIRNLKIRDLAKKLFAAKEGASDWEKVEALYDGMRERVKYQNGKLKGALAALNDGTGDCEEMTSLFIALCRVNGIPARTVHVPEHCYPEFYLVDKDGKGRWFPCQAAGTRAFGGMPDVRPIIERGDNFTDPDHTKPMRYLPDFLKIKDPGGQKPGFEFIHRVVGLPGGAPLAPAAPAPF